MAVTVKLRSIRHSARKLRPVARLVAGKKLDFAMNQTAVMTQDSARYIYKLLKMAEAAAKQKEFNTDELIVSQVFATEGPKIKRMRPNARGRANRYLKHVAHLTIVVTPEVKQKADKKKKAEEK